MLEETGDYLMNPSYIVIDNDSGEIVKGWRFSTYQAANDYAYLLNYTSGEYTFVAIREVDQ